MQTSTAKPVLDEILEPVTRCLTIDNAQELLNYRPKRKVRLRLQKLARKCNEGQLTPEPKHGLSCVNDVARNGFFASQPGRAASGPSLRILSTA
jgi:hypothetical protein